jgi:transcriptional regulator with XRE-family HTH domain
MATKTKAKRAPVGSLIRAERERLGLTQVTLAERLGISQRTVSDMESNSDIKLSTLVRLGEAGLDLTRIAPTVFGRSLE